MKKLFLLTLSALCISWTASQAQTLLTINGGSMVLEPGAVLFVEGGIENINSGSIDNDGTIELQGDLLIDGTSTYDGTDPNTLRFSGGADSDATVNGAVFDVVEIDKDATFNVNLQDDFEIGGSLDFIGTNTKVVLGNNNLIMQMAATASGYDENSYVLTDGTGYMVKTLDADSTFQFPVGDANSYTPATLAANAGHTSDDMSVRVLAAPLEDGLAGAPISDAVDAMWDIEEGTTGGSDVELTLEWGLADENGAFDRTESGVSHYDATNMDWDLTYAATSAAMAEGPNRWSQTRSGVSDFSPYTVGGESVSNTLKLDITIILQGAVDGGSPVMQDSLRAKDLLDSETSQPYTALGFIPEAYGGNETVNVSVFDPQGAAADDIVDWVWVELRDAVTPTTVLATKAALLTRAGKIVDLDGASDLEISGLPSNTNYHIAVRHRNHLGVRTASAQMLSGTATVYDFTSALAQAHDDGMVDPDGIDDPAMVDIGGGVFALWGGDANYDTNVLYNNASNDKNAVLAIVGLSTPNNIVSGYHPEDVNMDGDVKYNGASNDKNFILGVVGLSTPNNIVSQQQF